MPPDPVFKSFIEENFSSPEDVRHAHRIAEFVEKNKFNFNMRMSDEKNKYIKSNEVHMAALLVGLPVLNQFVDLLLTVGLRLAEEMPRKWPIDVQLVVLVKAMYIAAISGKGNNVHPWIRYLYKENAANYGLAMLFADAMLFRGYSEVAVAEAHNRKYDALLHCVCGMTAMLRREWNKAECELERALCLAQETHELREFAVGKLMATYFLNHRDIHVLEVMVPSFHKRSDVWTRIWDLESDYDETQLEYFEQHFKELIRQERARRILLDTALTVRRIPLQDLLLRCGVSSLNSISIMPNEVEMTVSDNIVTFGELYLTESVKKDINTIKADLKKQCEKEKQKS